MSSKVSQYRPGPSAPPSSPPDNQVRRAAPPPIIRPCGDSAVTVQLGDVIDPAVNARAIALAARLMTLRDSGAIVGLLDIVPAYCTLLVSYDPAVIRGRDLEPLLHEICTAPAPTTESGRRWLVPCHYGGRFADDLEEMAQMKGLTTDELITIHSSAEYRVYMIGFAPGFVYMGGQPPILDTPRLARPRQNIPRGAVGIGGRQGNISPVDGPSGWRFVGWTPLRLFDPHRAEPFLVRAGDQIRFRPIDAAEAQALDARSARGEAIVTPERIVT